jgi:hypothetical protein
LSETDAGSTAVALAACDRIRAATECALVIVHHVGYSAEHARGSSSLEDAADRAWLIQLRGGQGGGEKVRMLTARKNRDGELAAPRELTFTKLGVSGYVQLVTAIRWTVDMVIDWLDERDVDVNAGRPAIVRDWDRDDDPLPFSGHLLREAIKIRKARAA